ncbi:MAG: CaiB/BaiF CoA-transferase family protein [Actinomycetota bacterium]
MSVGPLAGLRVLEIASLAPAPFGCMLLADLGADIIRVERAGVPAALRGPGGAMDRNRRSITVDLKNPAGIAAVLRMAREADVFVEGFRPGVAERLGIGPEATMAANPRLIYARMTGWGQEGPLAARAGHDINYVSIAGALEPLGRAGERPHAALNLLGDFAGGGTFMALGILAAVYEREKSGIGQVVDAAMIDGASTLMTFIHAMHAAGRWSEDRGSNLLDGGVPFYETYETSDGKYMALGSLEPQFYAELLHGLGITDDAEQMDPATWPDRAARFRELFLTRTRDEWTAVFDGTDACVTPVLSPWEAHLHPHNIARDGFIEIDGAVQPAPAPRFSRTPAAMPVAMDDGGHDPSGTLASWGLDPEEVSQLLQSSAVC